MDSSGSMLRYLKFTYLRNTLEALTVCSALLLGAEESPKNKTCIRS